MSCCLLHFVGMCISSTMLWGWVCVAFNFEAKMQRIAWKHLKQQEILEHTWTQNGKKQCRFLIRCEPLPPPPDASSATLHPNFPTPSKFGNRLMINVFTPGGRWPSMFWQTQISGEGPQKVPTPSIPWASKIYGLGKPIYSTQFPRL